MYSCEFCNKIFKTIYTLEYHKQTTKRCLHIQNTMQPCSICRIKLKEDEHLEHLLNCELKKLRINVTLNDAEIKSLKEQVLVKEEEIKNLKEENKRLQDQLFKLAEIGTKKKTVVINNRVGRVDQRVVNQLVPYSITQEKVSEIVNEKFDKSYLTSKERGLAKFALDNILRDENGKPQMICTDPARRNFLYKNNEDEIFKDPDATNFTDMYINPVEKKSGEIIRESEELNEEDYNLLIECLDTFDKIRKNRSVFTRHLAKKLSLRNE